MEEERSCEPDQFAHVASKELQALLHSALDGLHPKQRSVFVLFEIEEVPMEEVARLVGLSLSASYSRLYKARAHVARRFARGERVLAQPRFGPLSWGVKR